MDVCLFVFFYLAVLNGCTHFDRSSAARSPASLSTELALTPHEENKLRSAKQLIWVTGSERGPQARLQLFEKKEGQWRAVQAPWPAVVGSAGIAKSGAKVEGDKKTPRGVYSITSVYGKAPSLKTAMPYQVLSKEDKWVDDPKSSQYNRWIRGPASAESYENLWRPDSIYDVIVVLDYNRFPVEPGKGSAIFLHNWSGQDEGTAGCVALEQQKVLELVSWLDPQQQPHIRIGEDPDWESISVTESRR
jgi:L,D-peptidoglycan transpeptidase YkuD (ErfK/YbiS/YcfS/YnhG family)